MRNIDIYYNYFANYGVIDYDYVLINYYILSVFKYFSSDNWSSILGLSGSLYLT